MPRFTYEALDAGGRAAKGDFDAADRKAAAKRLAARGLRVTRLAESGKSTAASVVAGDTAEDHPLLHKPRPMGVHPAAIAFMRGFGELHEGGMPVGDAVKLMAARVTEPSLRALCKGLWRDLSEGMNLSAALSKRGVVFDESTVRLIEAGEATGNLVPVVGRIRDSYAKREDLRSRVIAALAYPLFLSLFALAVLGLFVFVIMPIMEKMMIQLGGKFPWHVKALMGGASLLVKGSPLIVALLVFAFFRLKKARANDTAKRRQDAFTLRTPLVGKAVVHAEASRLAELLSTLLSSGVNAAQALKLAERPLANSELKARFTDARRRVHDGTAISVALKDTGLFESEDLDLAAVGESSGALPRSFASMAERRRRALDAAISRIVKIISGTVLGLVVGLVFFCLVSIITTILSVSQNIKTH